MGFSGFSYQKHWGIIEEDVVMAVKDFVVTGFLLESMNRAHNDLVPKVVQPETLHS